MLIVYGLHHLLWPRLLWCCLDRGSTSRNNGLNARRTGERLRCLNSWRIISNGKSVLINPLCREYASNLPTESKVQFDRQIRSERRWKLKVVFETLIQIEQNKTEWFYQISVRQHNFTERSKWILRDQHAEYTFACFVWCLRPRSKIRSKSPNLN